MKIPAELLVDINKTILKCKWKSKEARKVKTTVQRRNRVGAITPPKLNT